MAKTMLAISLLVGAGACSSPAPTANGSGPVVTTPTTGPEPTTTQATTTEPEPTTTTTVALEPVEEAPTTVPTTRARSAPTTVPYVAPSPQSQTTRQDGGEGTDFWYRLATCESGNGAGSTNQFQFMGGTAEKVGYYAGASYSEQRAMAQDWAARLRAQGTSPGSTAGWPRCWWVAGGGS